MLWGVRNPCLDSSLLDFPCVFLLSYPMLPLCRPSPCPQHAPHNLRARGNSWLYPLPCGRRAAGHCGQVEQGWPPPAGREGARESHAGPNKTYSPDTKILSLGSGSPPGPLHSPPKTLGKQRVVSHGVCGLATLSLW